MNINYAELHEATGQNWFELDPSLAWTVERLVSTEELAFCEDQLRRIGDLIGGRIARNAEAIDKNSAQLVRWNREGDEINHVSHPAETLDTKRALWSSYAIHPHLDPRTESQDGVHPILPVAYYYLLAQADTGMVCSVGMTAGVRNLIERYGDPATQDIFIPMLETPDFDAGWDGSMYLTERTGGSDLGTTTTIATQSENGWRLNGFKWFCSNVDGDAIVTLARPEGAPAGIKGLGLFAVPRWLDDGTPNGVHIRRIKEKLGTRSVPTGEIDLVNAVAYPLAADGHATDGRGINRMMEFVNVSRMIVAAMGAGIARRVFLESMIRASQRKAFGKPLTAHPMVRSQLISLMVASEASAALLFESANRVPRDRMQPLGHGDPVARILVPLTKLRGTRTGQESASAALELFGGNGVIEDWPMARQYRDAQVHPIWEGTENVLSLDVLRTMATESAHVHLLEFLSEILTEASHELLSESRARTESGIIRVQDNLARLAQAGPEAANHYARTLANDLADLCECALLLREAQWELDSAGTAHKALVAAWLTRAHFEPDHRWNTQNQAIVTDLFEDLVGYAPITPEAAAKYCSAGASDSGLDLSEHNVPAER